MSKREKQKRAIWIDRVLFYSPLHIGLCLSEKQFKTELKILKVKRSDWPPWIKDGNDATTHFFEKKTGKRSNCSIVCADYSAHKSKGKIEIYGLLTHEAVHIWQAIREEIGEKYPGKEFEAYSIQMIAQTLVAAYRENCN